MRKRPFGSDWHAALGSPTSSFLVRIEARERWWSGRRRWGSVNVEQPVFQRHLDRPRLCSYSDSFWVGAGGVGTQEVKDAVAQRHLQVDEDMQRTLPESHHSVLETTGTPRGHGGHHSCSSSFWSTTMQVGPECSWPVSPASTTTQPSSCSAGSSWLVTGSRSRLAGRMWAVGSAGGHRHLFSRALQSIRSISPVTRNCIIAQHHAAGGTRQSGSRAHMWQRLQTMHPQWIIWGFATPFRSWEFVHHAEEDGHDQAQESGTFGHRPCSSTPVVFCDCGRGARSHLAVVVGQWAKRCCHSGCGGTLQSGFENIYARFLWLQAARDEVRLDMEKVTTDRNPAKPLLSSRVQALCKMATVEFDDSRNRLCGTFRVESLDVLSSPPSRAQFLNFWVRSCLRGSHLSIVTSEQINLFVCRLKLFMFPGAQRAVIRPNSAWTQLGAFSDCDLLLALRTGHMFRATVWSTSEPGSIGSSTKTRLLSLRLHCDDVRFVSAPGLLAARLVHLFFVLFLHRDW